MIGHLASILSCNWSGSPRGGEVLHAGHHDPPALPRHQLPAGLPRAGLAAPQHQHRHRLGENQVRRLEIIWQSQSHANTNISKLSTVYIQFAFSSSRMSPSLV